MTLRLTQPDDLGLINEPFSEDEIRYLVYAMESWCARSDTNGQRLLGRLHKMVRAFEISHDDGCPTIPIKENLMYVTRAGKRVAVASTIGRPFELFIGTNGVTYHEDGQALGDGIGVRDYANDIVATTEPHTLDIACGNG